MTAPNESDHSEHPGEALDQPDLPDLPGEPPTWPVVVGWFSVGWVVLYVGCAGCGLGFQYFGASMMGGQAGQFPPMTPGPGMLAFTAFGILLDVVLLAAAIACVTRRPVARPLHLFWAVMAIAVFPIGVWLQLQVQADLKQWVADNPGTDYAKMAGSGSGIGNVIGMAVGAVIGLAWPVFCLVWFGLVKRRPADFGPALGPAA